MLPCLDDMRSGGPHVGHIYVATENPAIEKRIALIELQRITQGDEISRRTGSQFRFGSVEGLRATRKRRIEQPAPRRAAFACQNVARAGL